jgi:TM2 domain-containing membrane protein YozV
MAILYSFTGQFQQAKEVLDTQWLLIYCGVLVFAVWDSYRLAIEFNKLSVLGDREYAPMTPTALGAGAINLLDKRTPWLSIAWSMVLPGLGQLYNGESIKAIFVLIVGSFIIIFSHALQAIGFSALGDFQQAKTIIHWQWFLNIPSFYGFAVWDVYQCTVMLNKLFDIEQAQFFKNKYQNPNFKKPLSYTGG